MDEAFVRLKICHGLHEHGYEWYKQRDAAKCYKCGTLIVPPSGVPDVLFLREQGVGMAMEAKVLKLKDAKSFAFGRITSDQRDKLDKIEEIAYIGLGIIDKQKSKDTLVAAYLVPWIFWKEVESLGEKSIPFRLKKGEESPIVRYDIVSQFYHYKLVYEGGKITVPYTHPAT